MKNQLRKLIPEVGQDNLKNREIWLENTLKQLPEGSTILDAGAGESQYKKFCGHLKYVSQDLAQYDGRGNHAGLQTGSFDFSHLDIVSDIINIPRPDASFDTVMCIEVLEHIPDPLAALKELARLIRPEGSLILTAPFCSLTHFAPAHFTSGFNRYFFEKHFENLGLEIISLETNGNFFSYLAQELTRLPSMADKYTGKKLSFLSKTALLFLLKCLKKLSRADQGSSDLLCYGFHILARKKKSATD